MRQDLRKRLPEVIRDTYKYDRETERVRVSILTCKMALEFEFFNGRETVEVLIASA